MNITDLIKNDNSSMMRASCMRRLDEIYMSCGKIPLAKLLTLILRPKGEIQNDPYFWSDRTFLKKLEQYQKEFIDTYNPVTGEFDLNEEYDD